MRFWCSAAVSLLSIGAFSDDSRLASLRVPDGFEITSAVAPGLTAYPMFMNLDDQGRLFIAESTGKDLSGKEMAAMPECRILRLDDSDRDGVFDARTIFATELSLPMGVLWYDDALFVASPPDLLRFDDTDGDGVADRRTVLLTGWNILNTASLHGPFLGPDGWLYLTHGRHGYDITTKEGERLQGLAARIWRCRPDGTGLERYAGGGFDNPVELVFTPDGQMFGTMTYFTDPRHGQRDALMHWVWGGVYPKPHAATAEFIQTGPLMPTMTKFARIAPAGFMQYQGHELGGEYRGALFSAQFNPHRVQSHRLVPDGSTFRTEDRDFLTTTDPDFYPTDVLEDVDGSLLICDTGAWYVDACPISRVAKPEITGSIYRVRHKVYRARDESLIFVDTSKCSNGDLLFQYQNGGAFEKSRAFRELVSRGQSVVRELSGVIKNGANPPTPQDSPSTRAAVVWAVYQIGGPDAADVIRGGLNDRSPDVRIAAMQALGSLRDVASVPAIAARLKSEHAVERREAAVALGRVGDPSTTADLLAAAVGAVDRFEQHAITYALIDAGDRSVLWAALTSDGAWATREAALVALDQLHDPMLKAGNAIPLLKSASSSARATGLWVAAHHPEWSPEILGFVDEMLRDPSRTAETNAQAREILLAYASTGDGQVFVAERVQNAVYVQETRLLLMDIMDASGLGAWPESRRRAVGESLSSDDSAIQWRALELTRKHRMPELEVPLGAIADDGARSANVRVAALAAIAHPDSDLSGARFDLVLGALDDGDPGTRQTAATILSESGLSADSKTLLAKRTLPSADALVLTALLRVFAGESDAALGLSVVDGLSGNPKTPDLLTAAQLDALLQSYPASVRARAAGLSKRLGQRDAGLMERFLRLEPQLGSGDVGRGHAIFFGETASCSTCHAIGDEGGSLGPDLTTIGLVRSGHDLLESIMFPSSSMVPDFQPYTLDVRGELLSGIITRETADTVTLQTAATESRSVNRSDIGTMTPGTVSMMPEGLDGGLDDAQLLDLIAFLLSLNNEQWLLPETRE